MPSQKCIYELTILEHHLDTFGHMNHATYLKILEEARWDILTKKNFGHDHIQKNKLGPTILDIHIRFKKEIRLRENIRIETAFTVYNKRIGEFTHEIFDSSGDSCCVAYYKYGLFDMKQRKLVVPTQEWLNAIGLSPIPKHKRTQ